MDQEFLKESFKTIRVQSFEQVIELLKSKLHTTSDPRIVLSTIDEIRVMINLTVLENANV